VFKGALLKMKKPSKPAHRTANKVLYEFGLPSPPWIAYTLLMKTFDCDKLSFIVIAFLIVSCQPKIIESEGRIPIQNFYRDNSGERHDAVELDPRYKEIFKTIDHEVRQSLRGHERQGKMGFVHIFWRAKEQMLIEKHGIHWRNPAHLNPDTSYD
jgi:hypothetical protein